MKMEKIAIIGAGAVGCGFGFLLTRAGREVTLIGRADQVRAIQTDGLKVEGYAGEHQVKIPAAECRGPAPCQLPGPGVGDPDARRLAA
jgi:ketopantoate reductase